MDHLRDKLNKTCFFGPRLALRSLGISVNSNESSVYQLYSFLALTLAFLYPCSSMHVLMLNLDNFDAMANAVFHTLGGSAAVAKIMVILYNRRRLEKMFEEIERIQEKYNTEEWSRRETYNINKKVITYLMCYYIALLYLYVGSLAGRLVNDDRSKWRMPVVDVSLVNTTYSPNFEIAWAYQVVSVTIASSSFCITDFLLATIIMDLIVQFKIFGHSIKQTFKRIQEVLIKNNQTESKDGNWLYLNSFVKKMVIRHLSLINLVNEAENIFSHLVLSGVVGSLCVACFALYYASALPLFDDKAIQSYVAVTMIPCSLFIMCYSGTKISQISESVAAACYEIDFLGTDVRFQKSLMLIIMRSQKPLKLTVGGFVDLSLPVFVWILRSTYTFFTILSKTNDGNAND